MKKIAYLIRKNILLFSIVLGIIIGLFAYLFNYLIGFLNSYIYVWLGIEKDNILNSRLNYFLLPILVVIGANVGLFIHNLLSTVEVVDLLLLVRLRKLTHILKNMFSIVLGAIFTIGFGGTAGKQGPIAYLGGGIGYIFSRLAGFSAKLSRKMFAVGIGAAISALFKAPLAGLIFGAEVFYRRDFDFKVLLFGFAASASAYLTFCYLDNFDSFFLTSNIGFDKTDLWSLPFFILFGIVSGYLAKILIDGFYFIRKISNEWFENKYIAVTFFSFLSAICLIFAKVGIASGNDFIPYMLNYHVIYEFKTYYPLLVLLAFIFLIGSGAIGGLFGPTISIGAFLGIAFVKIIKIYFGILLDIKVFAVVGMASMFAAISNAPLSTVILITEMAKSSQLTLPAMIAVFFSYLISGEKSLFKQER